MTTTDFIGTSLHEIQSVIPYARLEYQYDETSNTHFIKISPKKYYDDERFVDAEEKIFNDFCTLEYDGVLCFITDGALTSLDNPSIVLPALQQSNIYLGFPLVLNNLSPQCNLKSETLSVTPYIIESKFPSDFFVENHRLATAA